MTRPTVDSWSSDALHDARWRDAPTCSDCGAALDEDGCCDCESPLLLAGTCADCGARLDEPCRAGCPGDAPPNPETVAMLLAMGVA